VATPSLTEGPYTPDKIPLDTDNDLPIINDALTPAVGEISYLTGRVLGAGGEPVRHAFVETLQVDSRASYIYSRGRNPNGYSPPGGQEGNTGGKPNLRISVSVLSDLPWSFDQISSSV
jgi:protocatechuate 3,4-dioxygenase beta subunit